MKVEALNNLNSTGCKGCGSCCMAIWLGTDMKGIKRYLDGHECSAKEDAKFIVENWKQITTEEAKEINPHFDKTYPHAKDRGFFFTCSAFDHEKRSCTKYLDRPNLCRDFPFYPGSPHHKDIDGVQMLVDGYTLYSKDCGFQSRIASAELWNRDFKRSKESLTKEMSDGKEIEQSN